MPPAITKTPRQPTYSAIAPEQAAPAIWPMIMMTVKRPSVIWRSVMLARSPIAAMAIGMMPPATTPLAARSASSASKLGAKDAAIDSSTNSARQVAMVRILPTASAIGPSTGWPNA